MRAVHEFKDNGTHRLGVSAKVKGDLTKDGTIRYGAWTGYRSPAILQRGKTMLVAVTDYYTGSVEFPSPDKLYIVAEARGYTLEVDPTKDIHP